MSGKYDMGVPKRKHVFRKQLARMAPDIRTDELHGAIRYYDCQVDDARLVDDDRADRGQQRCPDRDPHARSPASCARGAGSSASRRVDLENEGRVRGARARS